MFDSHFLIYISELTYRFQTAPFTFQRTILKYMLPWLRNVQLVGVTANDTSNNSKYLGDSAVGALEDGKIPLPHVEMSGDGWGSSKATQLVLNNLFFLTVKV